MSHQILFTSLIIIYILSLVVCLVAASLSSRISPFISKSVIILHFVFLLISVYLYINGSYGTNRAFAFAISFCLGIIAFGMISRKAFPLIGKIYFGIFLLSLPLFIFSPSTVLSIISMGELKKNNADKISLGNNFFLEKQQAMILAEDENLKYKVIKRLGYFNKTIARDLYFSGNKIDSAKLVFFDETKRVTVRGYYKNKTGTDSADVTSAIIKSSRDTLIQIKKQN